ncbi:MAG: hypothetical protein KGN76_13225 [Acidobacteriota bacterium]|nr:hypothetical protein [Acidobacteriota bacterium]
MRFASAKLVVLSAALLLVAACGGSPTQPSPVQPTQTLPTLQSLGSATARPLSKTTYVAFGDSITQGTITMFNGLLQLVVNPVSYPYKLQNLLQTEHSDQRIHVYNEGVQGEATGTGSQEWGITRLPGVLDADNPQVLLLLEGVNDLDGLGSAGIQPTIQNLQTMIQDAQARGITVLLGTLLAQRPGGYRAISINLVQPFNQQLEVMAASMGVTVVDFYTPFSQDLSLLGPDGLHPNADGYTKMAQIWQNAIDTAFEEPLPTPAHPNGTH